MRTGASAAPNTVRGAGVLVALQGVAGLGFAVYFLARALGGDSTTGTNIYGEVAYFAIAGAAVVATGVALVLGRHWARSPAVVVELLLLGVAWYAGGPSGQLGIGVPVGLLSVIVLYLLFAERSREWFLGLDDDTTDDTADDTTGGTTGGSKGAPKGPAGGRTRKTGQ